MKIGVKVMPREVLLDSQGRAIEQLLKMKNASDKTQCRVGKFIELSFPGMAEGEAKAEAKKIAEMVLINPLIEKFEIQVLGDL